MSRSEVDPHMHALAQRTAKAWSATEYLPAGTVVRVTCDGTIGEITWGAATEVQIVHADKPLGRGPWWMRRDQIEIASDGEAAAYRERCIGS